MRDEALPLTAHLSELRTRIFRILIAWVAGSALAWRWREEIFAALLAPALRALGELGKGHTLQAIAPTEIFFTYLQCALLAGFAFALPVFFWQVWAFVAPGLYPQEKRVALPFAIGTAFGHGVVFPVIFSFFASFSSEFVEAAWTMREVFGFTTRMILAFGTGFELPGGGFFFPAPGLVGPRPLL